MSRRAIVISPPRMVDYSPTAARTHAFCEKKYYFGWLARRKQGWRKPADHPWRQVYELKSVTNRHAWAGNLYHQVMARILSRARYGIHPNEESARRLARAVAEAQFAFSCERRFVGAIKSHAGDYDDIPVFLALFEHAYDLPADGLLEETRDDVDRWLSTTFAWDGWEPLLTEMRRAQVVHVEPRDLLYTLAGARIRARMDLGILTRDDRFLLYDWKCYNDDARFVAYDRGKEEHQLLVYALWAMQPETLGLPSERVVGHIFNPIAGACREVRFTDAECADFELEVGRWTRLQARIFDEVSGVDINDLRGPYAPERSCPWCPLKGVCGKEIAWHTLT
jgi:hypothetical protein